MYESERITRQFLQLAIVEHNMDEAIKLFHDDAVVYEPEELPYGGTYRAPKAMQQLSCNLRSHLDKLSAWWIDMPPGSPEAGIIANEEYAVLYGAMQGRSSKTGKEFTCPVTERFRIRDGKVSEVWVFYHNPAVVWAACTPDNYWSECAITNQATQ
ncbi:MAG: nuclear transport factor 2 family protein [Spongiibacteraceae bacterium]